MCIVLYPKLVQIGVCFFVTPHHRCIIMHEVVDDQSLRKICHYQLTESAAALLSFRYPSIRNIRNMR